MRISIRCGDGNGNYRWKGWPDAKKQDPCKWNWMRSLCFHYPKTGRICQTWIWVSQWLGMRTDTLRLCIETGTAGLESTIFAQPEFFSPDASFLIANISMFNIFRRLNLNSFMREASPNHGTRFGRQRDAATAPFGIRIQLVVITDN